MNYIYKVCNIVCSDMQSGTISSNVYATDNWIVEFDAIRYHLYTTHLRNLQTTKSNLHPAERNRGRDRKMAAQTAWDYGIEYACGVSFSAGDELSTYYTISQLPWCAWHAHSFLAAILAVLNGPPAPTDSAWMVTARAHQHAITRIDSGILMIKR